MFNLSDREPVDESNAVYWPLLGNLQCNILSSHGRPSTHYFFLHFPDARTATRVLQALAKGELEPGLALESELRSRARRRPAETTKRFSDGAANFSTNLLLTAACYRQFFDGLTAPADPAFAHGMSDRDERLGAGSKLHDAPALRRGAEIHALFVVGYEPAQVDWQPIRAKLSQWLKSQGVQVREDAGYRLRHPKQRYPIEPFGYRDSISQPLFYKSDLEARRALEGEAATVKGGKWSSFATLALALVPDPNGRSEHACGSYVAYRKIEQKVDVFYAQAARLAAIVPPLADGRRLSRDEVADRLIGRHLDGQPLEPSPNLNDFAYGGGVCPMYAHVRKVNPRNLYSPPHRIARRATVYGPLLPRDESGRPLLGDDAPGDDTKPSEGGVGLMFFCCQASIVDGFEAVQAHWANPAQSGADTVIGQLPPGAQNKIGLNGSGLKYAYAPVVEVLDGEYFFAPSLSFFSKAL